MKTKTDKMPKTKSELLEQFIQIAIADGYSDYGGVAERLINETISIYENLPDEPKLQIPMWVADIIDGAVPAIEFQDQYAEATGTLCPISMSDLDDDDILFEKFDTWVIDNLELFTAYYNPLTRPFVEVVE